MAAARHLAIAAALALVACDNPTPVGGPIAVCAAQTGLAQRAARDVRAGTREPVKATVAEATAVNACLSGMGEPPITRMTKAGVYTPETGGAIVTAGTGYHGSVLVKVTIAPPPAAAAPVVAPPAKPGKLALPVAYPLLPGDAELWDTLTLAQQQRALLFLKDGSTIRASLRTE